MIVIILKKWSKQLPLWSYHFSFSSAANESSCSSIYCWHLALSDFHILVGLWWHLISIHCSLVTQKWLFYLCILPCYLCNLLWWGVCSNFYLKIWLVIFLLWLIILLVLGTLSDKYFTNIFSPCLAFLSTLISVPFAGKF